MALNDVETFDFPEVSIGTFVTRIAEEMEDDLRQQRLPYPILGIGLAGIGKTEGVRGLCAEHGWGFKEIRLCNYEESDLIGLPYFDEATHRTEHAPITLFPLVERDGEHGILLVDEFTSAPSNIQVPILQLTDRSRSIGQYKLPDGWKIIITGNGPNDGGTFTNLPGTVISRASCYRVVPTVSSWLDWAGKNDIHPAIRAFVKYAPDHLHGYSEDTESGYDRAFPCPRAWTKLSSLLGDFDKRYKNWAKSEEGFEHHSEMAEILVGSNIGTTTAREFMVFLQFEKDLVDPAAIIKADTPEKRKALAPARDPKTKGINRQAFFLNITHLADKLKEVIAMPGKIDAMRHYVDPLVYLCIANAANWVFESSDSKDTTTFALAEINSSMSGISAYIVSSPEFAKLCPQYNEFAKSLTGIFHTS